MIKPRTIPLQRRSAPPAVLLDVQIESVAFGGDGLVRHEGKVIFVPDSLPGERLRVELEQNKERFARARVRERLEAPAYAQPSPCPYAAQCGGCQWLSVPYPQQLVWKKEFITSALQRIGKIESPPDFDVQPSPAPLGYRNRIKIKLQHQTDGQLRPSYNAKGTHDLVGIASCSIAAEPLNRALQVLAGIRLEKVAQTRIYELELQHLPANKDQVSAHFLDPVPPLVRAGLREATARAAGLVSIIWTERGDAPRPFETERGMDYLTYGGQFQQVNRAANHLVRQWVEAALIELKVKRVLDLFCGSGNLSLGLLRAGIEVWGLEVSDTAIACAEANLRHNQLAGGTYLQGSADELREKFPAFKPDAIIVDPPRKGMAEALPALLDWGVPHFIYLSCDPNTLARDLKALTAAGYHIEKLQAFDFFPQTFHVETLVYLRKKESADH